MEISTRATIPADWADPILSVAQAQSLLGQAGQVVLQAAGGGHLLGVAANGSMADILTLYVPPELRQQGRAMALLETFLAYARAQGALGLTLEVRADNATAIRLYEKVGLIVQHRRVGYYKGVDALVLGVEF